MIKKSQIITYISDKNFHIQVEGLDNSFAPSLIQRMELTLLKVLSWRMDSTTPFSYIDLLIQSIDALNKTLIEDLTKRVTELLLNSLLGTMIRKQNRIFVYSTMLSSTQ